MSVVDPQLDNELLQEVPSVCHHLQTARSGTHRETRILKGKISLIDGAAIPVHSQRQDGNARVLITSRRLS